VQPEHERLQTMLMNILPASKRRAGLSNNGAVLSGLRRFDLERIEAPTLLISVEDDRYGTFRGAKYTAGQIRDARFIGLPQAVTCGLASIVSDFLKAAARIKSRDSEIVRTAELC
jgi:hypothetical protein